MSPPTPPPIKPNHVLIVGAGLAGPCLALALAAHNISSTLFEIRTSRSDSGGSISLGPSALQVLDRWTGSSGVYDAIRNAGYVYYRFGAYSEDGEKFGDIQVGREEPGGYPSIRIMRTALHKILLESVDRLNNLVNIKWGVKLERVVEDDDGVTAYFEDGSQAQGDILIGCDGVHSKVRQLVLGEASPKASYDGVCVVNGLLPTASAVLPSPFFTFPAFMFTSSGIFMTIPIESSKETLAWGISTTMPEHTREEWKQLEESGVGSRAAKSGFKDITTQPVRSLLDEADDKASRIWPAYSIPSVSTYHTSRLCLIGDAAHALPPNGLGSALAFEDAAILTRLLTEQYPQTTGNIEFTSTQYYNSIFSRFELIRRPRVENLRETGGSRGAALKKKTGPWVWEAKKVAFRAFFWWNNGVLQHMKETGYDVEGVDLNAVVAGKQGWLW